MGRNFFFVNPSDICMTWRIILDHWIQYSMSYVHDFSILGNFLPARMVTVNFISSFYLSKFEIESFGIVGIRSSPHYHKFWPLTIRVQKVDAEWIEEGREELSRIMNVVHSMQMRLKEVAEKNITRLTNEPSKDPRKRRSKSSKRELPRDDAREGFGSPIGHRSLRHT